MSNHQFVSYDPETLSLLRNLLDECWKEIDETRRNEDSKSAMAVRILARARKGERDRQRLRSAALMTLAA